VTFIFGYRASKQSNNAGNGLEEIGGRIEQIWWEQDVAVAAIAGHGCRKFRVSTTCGEDQRQNKKERKAQKSIGNRQLALGRRRHEGTNPGSWKRPRIFWLWAAQRFFWSIFVM
jgi:hypothetical protein